MSDYQEPCGYPVMDCALGVYVTKCEDRIEELEAALPEQIEWVKRLADDLIAAEGREAKLKAKMEKAVETLRVIEDASRLFARDRESDIENVRYAHECTRRICATTLAELSSVSCANLKGQNDE